MGDDARGVEDKHTMTSTTGRNAPARLWIGLAFCWVLLASCSDRCGSSPQIQENASPPAPTQPLTFSPRIADTILSPPADAPTPLLDRIPADAELVFLLANPGALAEAATYFSRWGIVNEDQIKNIQKDLQLNYGINPWDVASWARVGFRVANPISVSSHSGHWIIAIPSHDTPALERFIDSLINEEFGRPRPKQRQVGSRSLKQILIYARDFLSIACEGGYCYLVTGAFFDPKASDSTELLARILDQTSQNSLSKNTFLSQQIKTLGDGQALIFAPGATLANKLLSPPLLTSLGLPTSLSDSFASTLKDTSGICISLSSSPDSLHARLFADIPPESLSSIIKIVTPDPSSPQPLSSLLPSEPRGLLRLTFDPRALETKLLDLAGEEATARWGKLKREKFKKKQGVFTLYDIEQELLYNLSGQALVSLMRLDAEALALAEDPEALLAASDFALFLPLKDPSLSDALFGKIDLAKGFILEDKSVKDWLKRSHASLDISSTLGAQVITFSRKDQVLLRIIYKSGILAVFTGNQYDLPSAIARLGNPSSPPWSPTPNSPLASLLSNTSTWGLSFDSQDITALLGVRFKIIRAQISNILNPLRRISLRVRFEPNGLGLDLGIEMASPPKGTP
jgi:hypothetical protein